MYCPVRTHRAPFGWDNLRLSLSKGSHRYFDRLTHRVPCGQQPGSGGCLKVTLQEKVPLPQAGKPGTNPIAGYLMLDTG